MLALASEALGQILLCNKACVVNIEVMEGESNVCLSHGFSQIDGDGQEFSIIDLTVMIEINTLEDLVDLILGHQQLVEGSPDLIKIKIA